MKCHICKIPVPNKPIPQLRQERYSVVVLARRDPGEKDKVYVMCPDHKPHDVQRFFHDLVKTMRR